MLVRVLPGFLLGTGCFLLTALSQAATCSMDNDCPGDQLCENAVCVEASTAPPPPTTTAPAAPAMQPAAPPATPVRSIAEEKPYQEPPRLPPQTKRHSRGMMA